MFKLDPHVHTAVSYDAVGSPAEVLEAAKKAGLDGFAMRHGDAPRGRFSRLRKVAQLRDIPDYLGKTFYADGSTSPSGEIAQSLHGIESANKSKGSAPERFARECSLHLPAVILLLPVCPAQFLGIDHRLAEGNLL